MKLRKNVVVGLLAGLLALTTAACGGGEAGDTDAGTTGATDMASEMMS